MWKRVGGILLKLEEILRGGKGGEGRLGGSCGRVGWGEELEESLCEGRGGRIRRILWKGGVEGRVGGRRED